MHILFRLAIDINIPFQLTMGIKIYRFLACHVDIYSRYRTPFFSAIHLDIHIPFLLAL
jgi:hypothetical protein